MIGELKRPLSLVEFTMEAIRSSIINGKLSLGQQITESFLQKKLGLSKTPIRESLALLKGEGLVVSEAHKGFRVFKMDEKDLSEFCEYRLALESQALRAAYKFNRLELTRVLNHFIKDFNNSINNNDHIKFNLTDSQFHKSFFILSSNRYLIKNYENINSIIETIRTHSIGMLEDNYKLIEAINGHISIHKHIEEKKLNLLYYYYKPISGLEIQVLIYTHKIQIALFHPF